MATDYRASLTAASSITWTSGLPFNGYVLLLMALPSSNGATWTRVSVRDQRPKLHVPTRFKVPIREGVLDTTTKVWRTDGLVPTNVQYTSFFYDDNDQLIASGGTLFPLTTSPFTLAIPSLADGTAAVAVPTPETVPSTGITVLNTGVLENVTGTRNNSNNLFSISHVPTQLVLIIWNGLILEENVGFVRAGTTITMQAGYIPRSTDSLKALII